MPSSAAARVGTALFVITLVVAVALAWALAPAEVELLPSVVDAGEMQRSEIN